MSDSVCDAHLMPSKGLGCSQPEVGEVIKPLLSYSSGEASSEDEPAKSLCESLKGPLRSCMVSGASLEERIFRKLSGVVSQALA